MSYIITILNLFLSTFILLILLILCTLVFLRIYYSLNNKKIDKCNVRIDGKIVLITGGNSGIGLETARGLARRGARVIIASRNVKKSSEAVKDIIETTGNKHVEYKHLDLANFASIRKFADDFNDSYDRLDILINNSGCAALKNKITKDGFNILMQINYFGPFYLTNLLLNKIKSSEPSRIINVSSLGHLVSDLDVKDLKGLRERHFFIHYTNSKLCMLLWTKALAEKLPRGVTVNALHPGIVQTPIFKMPKVFHVLFHFILGWFLKDSAEGAQTTIYCAVSEELAEKTGRYFDDSGDAWLLNKVNNRDLINKVWDKTIELTDAKNFANL